MPIDINLANIRGECDKIGTIYAQDLTARDQIITGLKSQLENQNEQIQNLKDTLFKTQNASVLAPPSLIGIENLQGWQFTTDHKVDATHPHGQVTWTPYPTNQIGTQVGSWTQFSIKPAANWDNFYNYYPVPFVGDLTKLTRFAWYGELSLPSDADSQNCQAPEFELEQCIDGTTFDTCAIQFPHGGRKPFSKFIRYFDKVKKWQDTNVPYDPLIFSANKIVKAFCSCYVDHAAKLVYYDKLNINGQVFDLSALPPCQPGVNQWGANTNYLHFSVQIDPVKSAPVTMLVRNFMGWWS